MGQQRESARNVDWPRIDQLANYTRTMDWDAKTMKEEFDRKPGLNPASWKYGIGWIDGPLQKKPHQIFMVNGGHAWHMDGPDRAPGGVAARPRGDLPARHVAEPARLPQGRAAARRQSAGDMAMGARRNGTRRSRGVARKESRSFRSPSAGKYRVDATINKEHMLQRIHTWVPDPVLGDMNYEHEFTERELRRSWQRHQVPDRRGTPIKAGTTTTARRLPAPATTRSAGR